MSGLVDAADRERESKRWRQFGAWMKSRRAAMKPDAWTQARLAAELTVIGHKVTREWIVQVEGGSPPSPELAAAIQRLLGPAPAPEDRPVDLDALVQAIANQTEAINRLVDRLGSLASEAIRQGVSDALREAAEAQASGASLLGLPPGRRP